MDNLIIVALNLLAAITPTAVYACTCTMPESASKELARSTAVFAGKVTGIQSLNWLVFSSADPVNVTFEVSEVWKGLVQKIQTVRTARSGKSCGYSFTAGTEYLAYANGSEANLEVFLCSRTKPLTTAVTDLIDLGAGSIPAIVAPVSWLPTMFFTLLGLFLIVSGVFTTQINRRLEMGDVAIFSPTPASGNPHVKRRSLAELSSYCLVWVLSYRESATAFSLMEFSIYSLFPSRAGRHRRSYHHCYNDILYYWWTRDK